MLQTLSTHAETSSLLVDDALCTQEINHFLFLSELGPLRHDIADLTRSIKTTRRRRPPHPDPSRVHGWRAEFIVDAKSFTPFSHMFTDERQDKEHRAAKLRLTRCALAPVCVLDEGPALSAGAGYPGRPGQAQGQTKDRRTPQE